MPRARVEATVQYRRPAQGTLQGTVSLSQDQQNNIRAQPAQDRKIRFPFFVSVLNRENTTVLELDITWITRKPRGV